MIALPNNDGERAAAIRQALADLHIDELHVEVSGDRAYLQGGVACYNKKREAEDLARKAAPSATIENELRVGRAFNDEKDIEREVRAGLAAMPGGVLDRVAVTVRGGMVHLSGIAQSDGERQAIECAAWNSCSISGVDNRITLTRSMTDDDIARGLTAYVERTLNVQPGTVSVNYHSGTAYLSGQVSSMTQSQAIEDLVRWHDQVHDVVNRLSTSALRIPRIAASASFRRE